MWRSVPAPLLVLCCRTENRGSDAAPKTPMAPNRISALRFRITEIRNKLEEVMGPGERAMLALRLHDFERELGQEIKRARTHPCPYGLVEFGQNGKASFNLPQTASAADFLHAFAHVIYRNLSRRQTPRV